MRRNLTRNDRLRKKKEIAEVLKSPGRIYSQEIAIRFKINGRKTSRVCVTLKRGFGNAVTRNRYKRYMKEIFRLNKHKIQGGFDFVFILSSATRSFFEMQQVVMTLLRDHDLLITEGEAGV
ncbi:MAG: ribonuclease P protein component [Spirochaetaceae bacterium]|nr:MAG: ribonuclease P protein component [Spirochaetaceae bacterium]